ncbi:MAG: MerR family transcriptional regulator [Defluviitaleaceae bacterium]|nr:MerR family transcriptional regulator [Defluviitaleaceae bacterium]
MFKIGEFSKLVRVSARMLRHYDKCGLLRPAEIDRFTGYRMYSAEQIPFLMRVVELRDMGFGVEEIEETLPYYDNAEFMRKALERKAQTINDIIATEQHKLDKITAMSAQIRKENDRMVYEVELKEIPAIKAVSLREIVPSFEDEVGQWEKMWAFIKQNGIDCKRTGYSIYHDDEYKDEDVDMEIAVPVSDLSENKDGFVYKELEAIPLAATIQFPGPYDNYNKAIEKLAAWIEQNDYEFAGLIRGHGIIMPFGGVAMEDCLTELQVPVKKV